MHFEIVGEIREIEDITETTSAPDVTRMNVKYVICVNNEGHRDSLEVRKVYLMLPDDGEPDFGLVRVIDESGEDYLYPADRFVTADLTEEGVRAVFAVVL